MTLLIEAFAGLGRAFAEQTVGGISDPDVLTYVSGVVRPIIGGRNIQVKNVMLDGDTFKGEAHDRVNPRLTKRFAFEISPDSKSFHPLNGDEIEFFAEPVEFQAGGKKLNCKISACGGRCLRNGEKCRLTMSAEEHKAHVTALRKAGTVDTSLAKKRREMKEAREADKVTKETVAAKKKVTTRQPKNLVDSKTDTLEKNSRNPNLGSRQRNQYKWIEKQINNPDIPDSARYLLQTMPQGMARPFPLGDSRTRQAAWHEWARNALGQAGIDYDKFGQTKAAKKNDNKKEEVAKQVGTEDKKTTKSIRQSKSKTSADSSATAKVHSVTKQQDFDDLVMHVYGKLDKKHDGLVPIYKIRREIGELVPRDKFNKWLLDMQRNDKLLLVAGEKTGGASGTRDSLVTPSGGRRTYIRLGDKGQEAISSASKRSKKLDDTLKNRPDLDPLGTASQLSKGSKIKTQSEFDKVALDAHKRLDEEFNHDNLVPIADVRKALGDRVSKKQFDDHLLELQANDKVQLVGDENAPKELQDSGVSTSGGGKRVYMKKL